MPTRFLDTPGALLSGFPLTKSTQATQSALMEERIKSSLILIVEDEPVSRKMTGDALKSNGFSNVHDCNDGRAALDFVSQNIPDLVILDLMMPEVDGFMFCQTFKLHPELRDVPILVYTALENELKRLSILEMGASDLAIKPINQEELISRCRIHLEKRYILKDLQDYRAGMEADLSHARAMQNLLMPDDQQVAQTEADYGLDIGTVFSPSIAIGGDFWGVHALPQPGQLAIYIGDFTGHGVTAAINVFRLSALMSKLPEEVLAQPRRCLSQLSAQLHTMLPIELFATMFYGVIDIRNDTLTYSMAGCPPPLLLRGGAINDYQVLEGSGLPLAAIRAPHYRNITVAFQRGDALMLYSDALIETPNTKGNRLELQDIAANLSALPLHQRQAHEIKKTTMLQLHRFIESSPIEDDLTLNIYRRI